MNLGEATVLLGSQGREFSEVYKLYAFRDDQPLREYLDFIVHEPVEWLKGFPARWTTRASFSKPKTALIKLLKHADVLHAHGADYIRSVYECVWGTFKRHADSILEDRHKRNGGGGAATPASTNILQQMEGAFEEIPANELVEEDAASIHSVKIARGGGCGKSDSAAWERKYKILERAFHELLSQHTVCCPGMTASSLILLDALSTASFA
jgi:hypothetical protein